MTTVKQHILVVDDEPDFVAYLQAVLEGAGYEVSSAVDGEDALASVRMRPPDLVTLDIQMPRKTGVLFYRQMKAEERFRSIPVIVVTGLRTLGTYAGPFVERFFEIEHPPLPKPAAYLDKPVDKSTLLSLVSETLASGSASAAP